MKKILLFAALAAAVAANAQTTYNYFDPADCDADGWLWFDSQAKIDKYLDWYNPMKLGTDSPKLFLVSSTWENADGEYAEPYADPDVKGYNAEGVEGGEGSLTGALVLSPSSSSIGAATADGGGFVLFLPDCAQIDINLSQEVDRVLGGVYGAMGWQADIDCNVIRNYMSMGILAKPIATVFQYTWNNIQNLENSNDVSCHKLAQPKGTRVTGVIRNNMNCDMLVHGVRIFTYTQMNYTSSVSSLASDNTAPVYYNLQGVKVSATTPGLYIVKQGDKVSKMIINN